MLSRSLCPRSKTQRRQVIVIPASCCSCENGLALCLIRHLYSPRAALYEGLKLLRLFIYISIDPPGAFLLPQSHCCCCAELRYCASRHIDRLSKHRRSQSGRLSNLEPASNASVRPRPDPKYNSLQKLRHDSPRSDLSTC